VRGHSQKEEMLDAAAIDEACALAFMGPFGRVSLEKRMPDKLASISVDRVQIQQAIYNILRNAAEALADFAEPKVVLTITDSAEWLTIRIEDNGPGLSKQRRQHLFQPLRSSKPNGMGVGLAISRSLVEGHGGTIRALESELGGAAFEICLPKQAPSRPL